MKKTYWTKEEDVERKWFVVDAEGKTLGRLASEIAPAFSAERGRGPSQACVPEEFGEFHDYLVLTDGP